MRAMRLIVFTAGLLAAMATPMLAQHAAHHSASDSAAVLAVIERFHSALGAGDSLTAISLLAREVIILESGGIETRDEYRAHHLAGDIAFSQAIKADRKIVQVRVRGDVAWVSSVSVMQGSFRERPINAAGAELIVLTREADHWLISAIHWSSRQRRSQ